MQPTTNLHARRTVRARRIAGCAVVAFALAAGALGTHSSADAATKKTTKKVVRRTATTKAVFVPPPTTAAPVFVPPPTTAAPVTVPPTTAAPTTTAPRNFTMVFDVASVTVRPGDTAAIPLTITRAGWSGPVDIVSVDTGSGLTPVAAPNPTSLSTVVYVKTAATTASGDYRVAVVGFVGSSVRYADAVVKVRGTESIVLKPITFSATAARGSTVHLYVNAVVVNNFDGSPAAITVTGLPAGTLVQSVSTAANSDVDVTLVVGAGTAVGTYNVTVTATRGASNMGMVIPLTVT